MVASNKVVQGCQMVRSVTLQERAGGDRAAVRLIGKDFDLDLKQISSSELAEVATSIAITLAQFSARYTPTVLVIDRMAASLDSDNLLSFVERLICTRHHFSDAHYCSHTEADGLQVAHLPGRIIGLARGKE